MATPFVTGAAALILSVDPLAPTERIRDYILENTTKLSTLKNVLATGGKLNVSAAVAKAKENMIPVTGVQLDHTKLDMIEGDHTKLEASLMPMKIVGEKIMWTSSDSNVAEVDNTGKVTALTKGIAIVTAKDSRTGFEATCQVNVSKRVIPVLRPGQSLTLTFSTPDYIDGETKLWMIRPDGTEISVPGTLDYEKGTYVVRITADKDGIMKTGEVDPFFYPGLWETEVLEITTQSGKIYTFYNEKYFDSTLPRARAMNFEAYQFILTDNLHPYVDSGRIKTGNSMDKDLATDVEYTKVEVSPKIAYIGNKVQLKIYGKAKAGIYTSYITFVKPDGTEFKQSAGVNARDGYFYCNMYVTDTNGSGNNNIDGVNDEGTWQVKKLQLYDSNYGELEIFDQRYTKDPQAADLSGLDFQVVNERVPAKELYFGEKSITIAKGKIIRPALFYGPDEADQPEIQYSSSNPKIATVNKYGIITTKAPGKVMIKAKAKNITGLSAKIQITVRKQ